MANKALSLGINAYKYVTPLRGCLNDVTSISSLVAQRLNLSGSHLRTITDADVTKDNVKDGLEWLKDVDAGDSIFLHFSGHGSYESDASGDEEDHRDEFLCLWDMQWGDTNSYIKDDELRDWITSIPAGVDTTVLLDCCHSGTGTRKLYPSKWPQLWHNLSGVDKTERAAIGTTALVLPPVNVKNARGLFEADDWFGQNADDVVVARFIEPPPEVLARTKVRSLKPRKKTFTDIARSAPSSTLFAACKDEQTAADARINGQFCGAFSFAFNEAMTSLPAGSCGEIYDKLSKIVADRGFSQIPQFEGHRDKLVFPSRTSTFTPIEDNSPMSENFNVLRIDWTVDLTDLSNDEKEKLKNLFIDKLSRCFESPETTRSFFGIGGQCSHERHERTICGGSASGGRGLFDDNGGQCS